MSINWMHAVSPNGAHPADRNSRFRDCAKSWLKRHAPSSPYVWLEVREKTRAEGEHVHLFFHVPDGLGKRFAAAVRHWVDLQSVSMTETAVDVRPVGHRWWDRRDYALKGGDAETRQRYNTRRFRRGSQGVIEGPRIRVSHSIGSAAQKAALEDVQPSAMGAPKEPPSKRRRRQIGPAVRHKRIHGTEAWGRDSGSPENLDGISKVEHVAQ